MKLILSSLSKCKMPIKAIENIIINLFGLTFSITIAQNNCESLAF